MHAVRKLLMALSMLTTFRTAVHALRKMITSGYHVVRRMVRILTYVMLNKDTIIITSRVQISDMKTQALIMISRM